MGYLMNPKPKIRSVPPPDGYLRVVRRRVPSRRYACKVCCHEVARQSTHEFARAKEVFQTTHIPYKEFLEQYVEGVIGFPVNYQSFMTHINNHVRPSIRREIREWEIENARPGEPWAPPDLSDFLVSPIDYDGRDRSIQDRPFELYNDEGLEPVEDLSHTEHPESAGYKVKDMIPDDGLSKTFARFWKSHGDDDAQKTDPKPE